MTDEIQRGAAQVCFDATPLILFADAGVLSTLTTWFGPLAYTAAVVTEVELKKNLEGHPQNREILKLPWLHSVPLEEDDDLRFVADLRRLWGSKTGRDHGEAEVVALGRRFGWTVVIDDRAGRDAARSNGVPCVSTAGMIAASVAGVYESVEQAWQLYSQVSANHDRPIFPVRDEYRSAFEATTNGIKRIAEQMPDQIWPHLLADQRIDALLGRAASKRRQELGK